MAGAQVSPTRDPWLQTSSALTYRDIRQELNWWFQLRDHGHRQGFIDSQDQCCLKVSHITTLATLYLLVYLPLHCGEAVYEVHVEAGIPYYLSSAFIILFLFVDAVLLMIVLLDTFHWSAPLRTAVRARRSELQSAAFLNSSCYFVLLFCKRNMFPLCAHSKRLWIHYNCSSDGDFASAALHSTCTLYTALLLFFINWQHLDITLVWQVFAAQITVSLACLCRANSGREVALAFIFWTLATFAIILDMHLRNILQYFIMVREREQAAQFTTELRHTIANVAHDLKTPLASFTNGADLLGLLLGDIEDAAVRHATDQARAFGRQAADCLTTIKGTTAFMTMAINRCLDSTKASNNVKLVPKIDSVDLMDAVGLPMSVVGTVQTKINIRLDVESVGEVVATHIWTDKQWLQENLLCLLSNAVKFSFYGLVILRVGLQNGPGPDLFASGSVREEVADLESGRNGGGGSDRCAAELVFEVEDEGIGVKDDLLGKLFHPFQASQRAAMSGGLGLGLYSLANRVEALKGRYGVRHRSDGRPGAVFWFSIPYLPDESGSRGRRVHVHAVQRNMDALLTPNALSSDCEVIAEARSAAVTPFPSLASAPSVAHLVSFTCRESSSQSCDPIISSGKTGGYASAKARKQGPRAKILVVDDVPTILKMLSAMLRRVGCEVVTGENGLQAVDIVQRDPTIDLVLMDLQMPVMDGLEATRAILQSGSSVVVVGMSANSDTDTVSAALQAGARRFISKPFSLDTFMAVLKEVLPERGQPRPPRGDDELTETF